MRSKVPPLKAVASSFSRFFPFLRWLPALKRDHLRPDLEAGLIGAILILPQAIAFATLAGMPPEYGIYTSIFPVIVAAIWGSSWHVLSGPNTAMCVLIAATVAPLAQVSSEAYIHSVLALTLLVGLIQLAVGVLRLGGVLDFISHTVISAIILAVALTILTFAAGSLLGARSDPGDPFFVRLYQVVRGVDQISGFVVAVGVATVVSGVLAWRFWPRYAMVIAVGIGTVCAAVLYLGFGSSIPLLGPLAISLSPFSLPQATPAVFKDLLPGAFSIAFIGLMQTIVIARSLARKSGQTIDTNQEILGQGLSNLVAPFVSSFASGGSVNRSAAHLEAGAKTPIAAIFVALFLGVVVVAGAALIAWIPLAAIAGTLILVGYRLVDLPDLKRLFRSRYEAAIFSLTFLTALGFGLNAGVATGVVLSLIVYLWFASTPNITVEGSVARDGRSVQAVTIDGSLFFGSVRHVERALAQLQMQEGERGVLLIRTEHLTYVDLSGAALIAEEAQRRRNRGEDLYLYVTRPRVVEALRRSGFMGQIGEDHLIHRDRDHPMKEVFYPYRMMATAFPAGPGMAPRLPEAVPSQERLDEPERIAAEELARRLKATKWFAPLPLEPLTALLARTEVQQAAPGDLVLGSDGSMRHHLVLMEGELEARRIWTMPGGAERSALWALRSWEAEGCVVLVSAARGLTVRALSPARYLLLDGDLIDEMLGWSQGFSQAMQGDPELQQRMGLVKHVSLFRQLPLEHVKLAFERMSPMEVQAGETVIRQGDKGDRYYLIESGEAEVWRADPFTDESTRVAILGPGDAFGEEALLQQAYRNATVTMLTPGRLLVLEKAAFDELLRPRLVQEIAPETALDLAQQGQARWLDCRYDLEYKESRIPGALHLPLDRLREDVSEIDPRTTYIVYCRSGRRSAAAVFLLRERNIKALSLAGGLREWPYELDGGPVHGPQDASHKRDGVGPRT